MSYEPTDLGFSTADAEQPRLRFDGDLLLEFRDWREQPVAVVFREVVGFRWDEELDTDEVRDDACYRVLDSEWLARQLKRMGALADAAAYTHLKLCFNAVGVLDVLCRSYELRPR